jgi:bacterioferritin
VQADPRIVELLNEVLTTELTAVNQYFLNSKMAGNWGYARLAKLYRDISLEEMKDTEGIIDRILYFDGLPNMQRLWTVKVGQTPLEQMELALELERDAVRRLNAGVSLCLELGDHGTREYLGAMIGDEEQHVDLWETQLDAYHKVGEANWLAQQLHV